MTRINVEPEPVPGHSTQDPKVLLIVATLQIRRLGAKAPLYLILPGTQAADTKIPLCKGGPKGKVIYDCVADGRLFCRFSAAEVQRYIMFEHPDVY